MIIMPSTPRLRTPERSTTSSPAAASKSGVDAAMIEENNRLKHGSHAAFRGVQQADPIDDEGIAGQHVEQQNALEHLGEIERHLHGDLCAFAADEGQGKKQSGDQNTDRIEPAEERDNNRGEAVAGRDAGLQMSDRPGDLDDAGKAGERA